MEIVRTNPGDADFPLFEDLPKLIYPGESMRHQQIDKLNLDFLVSCFVLVQDGMPKARVALYNNPGLMYEGKHAFCIGNFECVEDQDTASRLIDFVVAEARKLKAEYLVGPMNGSTWDNYRFSLHHDQPNFFLEPFHHLYYNALFTNAGFVPVSQYISSLDTELKFDYPDVLEREAELEKVGIVIRNIEMDHFEKELEKLYPLVTSAFRENFLYTPIRLIAFKDKYLQAAQLINPENVLIAENESKETVGFIFCYDDLYNRQEKSLIIKTIARDSSEKYTGLGQVMGNRLIRSLNQRNYQSLIHAFMIEAGVSTFASRKFHGDDYKRYVLYGKEI